MRIGCAWHINGTIGAIMSTIIIHVSGAPPRPGSPSYAPPQAPRFKSPVGLGLSPGGVAQGPEQPDTRAPPLCLSRPLPSPSSLKGSRGPCWAARRASWPEIRLLGSPAPVSMATARAESAAPSRGGHAPAAAYVTRRAARSQARGRIPARSGGPGRGRLDRLVLGPALPPAIWTGHQAARRVCRGLISSPPWNGERTGCGERGELQEFSKEPGELALNPQSQDAGSWVAASGARARGRARLRLSPLRLAPAPAPAPWELSARIGFQLSCGGQSSRGGNRRAGRAKDPPPGASDQAWGNPQARLGKWGRASDPKGIGVFFSPEDSSLVQRSPLTPRDSTTSLGSVPRSSPTSPRT